MRFVILPPERAEPATVRPSRTHQVDARLFAEPACDSRDAHHADSITEPHGKQTERRLPRDVQHREPVLAAVTERERVEHEARKRRAAAEDANENERAHLRREVKASNSDRPGKQPDDERT